MVGNDKPALAMKFFLTPCIKPLWFDSLDSETENGVMQAVQALQGKKTVIIVAHRLSTVEYCDRLYRLEDGKIVDEGNYLEVVSRISNLDTEI